MGQTLFKSGQIMGRHITPAYWLIVCVNYSRETISNRKDDKHRNRFDLSTSHFSPDGRVFQIEYAGQAVENSGTAVAIRGKDGVVFAV